MISFQIRRNGLFWIILAQLIILLTHFSRLPFSLIFFCLFCVGVRTAIYYDKIDYPKTLIKFLCITLGLILTIQEYHSIIGVEPGGTLLIISNFLKLIEMKQKRDIYITIILGYFTILSGFLFSQTISTALLMIIATVIMTAALIGVNQSNSRFQPFFAIRYAGIIVLQSAPLMLLLFIFFPRIPPLWNISLDETRAQTGFSDSISPGDVSNLSQSSALAFRVKFDSPIPDQSKLYWRGLVLSSFDGRSWRRLSYSIDKRRGNEPSQYWENQILQSDSEINYTVTLQPMNKKWLFTLMMPSITQNNLIFRSDFTTITEQPIRKLFQYQLTSNLNFYSSGQLTSQQAEIETRLPQWSNQKSIEFARQLYQKSNNTADYIDKILNHFTTEQFYYTLKPPFLGKNSVDDFLFTSKKGFCEHYASSFAFLMRAVNIPARVVVGYQGGEINPLGDYVVVHQYDAHAWNEVWIENRGWVRFDPTAAISPTRIEKGIEQAVSNEDSFLENDYLSLSRYKSNNLINSIRLYLDSANYLWNQWVVNYNTQKQLDFFKNWFKGFTRETIILLLGIFISCTTLLLSYFFILKLKPKSVDPLTRDYLHFCKQLNKKGLHRLEIDTPQTFANKIILKHPELTDRINYLTYLYNETQYGNKKNNDDKIKQAMKRIIKKIHKQS